MLLVPEIVVEHVQSISDQQLQRLKLILNFEAWKLERNRLLIVLNGEAMRTNELVGAIFGQRRVRLNYDATLKVECTLDNIHAIESSYIVSFEDEDKAAHMLPFFNEIEYFYVQNSVFYIRGGALPDLTWRYTIVSQFSPQPLIPYYEIFVDFEAYGKEKRRMGLEIYPSELGAAVVYRNMLVDKFHSFIRFEPSWANEAYDITGITPQLDAPPFEQVKDEFWRFCAAHFPFKLIAKGKFMEQHLLEYYVYEAECACASEDMHSKSRSIGFDCPYHLSLECTRWYKFHCALDDAMVLAKLRLCDAQVCNDLGIATAAPSGDVESDNK